MDKVAKKNRDALYWEQALERSHTFVNACYETHRRAETARKNRAAPKGEGPVLPCDIQKNGGLKPADPDPRGHGRGAQSTSGPAGGAHAQQGNGLGRDQRKE